jgi:hypothetical protein
MVILSFAGRTKWILQARFSMQTQLEHSLTMGASKAYQYGYEPSYLQMSSNVPGQSHGAAS